MRRVVEIWFVAGGLSLCSCAPSKPVSHSQASGAQTPAMPARDQALRKEILAMCKQDQKVREAFAFDMPPETAAAMRKIDQQNTARMKEIIAQHGWPGDRLVGKDGAHAAWLLVQHATEDLDFMNQCLSLMAVAVNRGDASGSDLAYLTDRVRVHSGKPQIYGTQFKFGADGALIAEPIEDAANVDARRSSVGLPSLAEYEKTLKAVYGKSSSPDKPAKQP